MPMPAFSANEATGACVPPSVFSFCFTPGPQFECFKRKLNSYSQSAKTGRWKSEELLRSGKFVHLSHFLSLTHTLSLSLSHSPSRWESEELLRFGNILQEQFKAYTTSTATWVAGQARSTRLDPM